MSATASCVHCLGPIRPPGLWSSSWQCDDHGDTLPFFAAAVPSAAVLDRLRALRAGADLGAAAAADRLVRERHRLGGRRAHRGPRDGGRLLRTGAARRCARRWCSSPRSRGSGSRRGWPGCRRRRCSAGERPGRGQGDGGASPDSALGAARRDERARRLRRGGARGLAVAGLLAVDRQPAADRAHAARRPARPADRSVTTIRAWSSARRAGGWPNARQPRVERPSGGAGGRQAGERRRAVTLEEFGHGTARRLRILVAPG